MRASSLSNAHVIDLINAHFVPVYVSNEDVRAADASPVIRKEINRIRSETLKAKMTSGTVHVYLLDPEGTPVGSQHVADASKVDNLAKLLETTVDKLKVPAGKPLVPPTPQSAALKVEPDTLTLHLVARNLVREKGEDVPPKVKLGTTRSGNWGAYPGEDWITFSKEQWKRLLPTKQPALGDSWELDKEIAGHLLKHFYPSTENNDISKNRIDRQELKATVISIKNGITRARLDGSLRMKHPFYHKDDDLFVEATLLGFLDVDVAGGRIVNLQIVTTEANYGRTRFGVAVRSATARQ